MESNQTTHVPVFNSFDEFWPFYLGQHAHPTCRKLHILGTTLAVLFLIQGLGHGYFGIITGIIKGLIVGYGLSWVGHFVFEKNRPATFTYPKWSFHGDFKMLKLFYTGKLDEELARLNITWTKPT